MAMESLHKEMTSNYGANATKENGLALVSLCHRLLMAQLVGLIIFPGKEVYICEKEDRVDGDWTLTYKYYLHKRSAIILNRAKAEKFKKCKLIDDKPIDSWLAWLKSDKFVNNPQESPTQRKDVTNLQCNEEVIDQSLNNFEEKPIRTQT